MKPTILFFLALISLTAYSQTRKSDVEFRDRAKPGGPPFSGAVRVDNMLYLSGQVGVDPATGKLVEGGIEAEAKQTLQNIKAALERNGTSLENVVKCTVFLADIKEWPRLNEVYKTFFHDPYPARSAVAGSGLALGARVEIECIAVMSK